MVSEQIQPLASLGPMDKEQKSDEIQDPAKKDYLQGREQYTAGDYVQAALSFHNALKGFEEQGNELGVANAADRLGDTCLAREEYAMAIGNYQRAFTYCEEQDDSFAQLALNKKMAMAYRKLEEHDKALELLYDMVEHYRLTQNPKGAVEVLVQVAETYIDQGEPAKAADAYRTVSGIHAKFKHRRLAADFAERAQELEQES